MGAAKMRAAVVHELGKPLTIEELDMPGPGRGESNPVAIDLATDARNIPAQRPANRPQAGTLRTLDHDHRSILDTHMPILPSQHLASGCCT